MRSKHNLNPGKSLFEVGKDTNKRHKQLTIVKNAFYSTPATMLVIARETGIERASICRYVATLRKAGAIALIKKSHCPITGFRAGFYTTNLEGGRNNG